MERSRFWRVFNLSWEALTWIVVAAGIMIRIFHFFVNRSLWLDEIYLASSLINMDFVQLALQDLDYEQKAPLGFLFIVKLCIVLLGNNEMALRLFPLVSGIAALILFKKVAGYFLNPTGVFISVSILAFAPFLVYHSVEIKQYSTAMLGSVISLFLYLKFRLKVDLRSRLLWGAAGAVLIWFTYSSVFVLAGIAAGVSLSFIFSRKWKDFTYSLIPFSLWMLSFICYYFVYLITAEQSEWLLKWFDRHNSFMPFPPSIETLKWVGFQFYRFLEYPLGVLWNWPDGTFSNFFVRNFMRMPLLPVTFYTLGVIALVKYRRESFMVLFFPIILLLVASGLELYPVYERLTVFIAPVVVLVIAKGAERFIQLKHLYKIKYIIISLLLLAPLANSARQIIFPEKMGGYKNTQYRETLKYIDKHYQHGDLVYVYWNFVPAYKVYKQLGYIKYEAIEGQNVRGNSNDEVTYFRNLAADLKIIAGNRRVWLIYDNHLTFHIGDLEHKTWYQGGEYGNNPGERILNRFKTMGKLVDNYRTSQASAHLFDLRIANGRFTISE